MEEAIRVEKSGKQVKMKNTDEYEMPEELRQALDNDETLQTAFNNLTLDVNVNICIILVKQNAGNTYATYRKVQRSNFGWQRNERQIIEQ